ncbi:Alpha/Beta hydrolase protein [Microdochium trichocladiopsis]|uniref:Alpha/Beta hydrolase protein n=1 Tax=Microdochium trichocladiopsis TaxID=1682393 RepID=A0A9P8XUR6_9PEZI|nr:Alpha/Beta hydrolase protein [Microdochium trichocladiopsis]KAH7018489.1 Alpha/Beta hydrolase protein [Microdochium trichocladiopsis]
MTSLEPLPLPNGLREETVDCSQSCGLVWHTIVAGQRGKPLILFCHGFPELAFSWRKVLPQVADAGFFCVAMDQRGYGRTTGWPKREFHDVALADYTYTNLVRDLVCLVYGLGYTEAFGIVGHDFGGVSSAMAAVIRPDVFRSTVQLSHPHHPPPRPQIAGEPAKEKVDIQAELAKLDPPQKHYKYYNSTAEAASHWDNPSQGLERFLRGYFHLKSADWPVNAPQPLERWAAEDLAPMPEYYIMQKQHSMPEAILHNMEGEDYAKTERWLSPGDLQVYCREWRRTGFQGALNWYRSQTGSAMELAKDMLLFAGRRIEVPCIFISGKQDWGNYQQPGALESYEDPQTVKPGCFRGVRLIDHAGHWVQQEQPEAVVKELLSFFGTLKATPV